MGRPNDYLDQLSARRVTLGRDDLFQLQDGYVYTWLKRDPATRQYRSALVIYPDEAVVLLRSGRPYVSFFRGKHSGEQYALADMGVFDPVSTVDILLRETRSEHSQARARRKERTP